MDEDVVEPTAHLIHVHGTVQGVGFRWYVRAMALEMGLVGYARNCFDGRVEILVQGQPKEVAAFVAELSQPSARYPQPGSANHVAVQHAPVRGELETFVIR